MIGKGSKVAIADLKGDKRGKVSEVFRHGNIIYYRVIYQNLGNIHMHTTTERYLKEI